MIVCRIFKTFFFFVQLEFDDMESLYERYKVPLPQPSSMEYGAYLREMKQRQLLQQQQQQQQYGDRIPSRLSQRGEPQYGTIYTHHYLTVLLLVVSV